MGFLLVFCTIFGVGVRSLTGGVGSLGVGEVVVRAGVEFSSEITYKTVGVTGSGLGYLFRT